MKWHDEKPSSELALLMNAKFGVAFDFNTAPKRSKIWGAFSTAKSSDAFDEIARQVLATREFSVELQEV